MARLWIVCSLSAMFLLLSCNRSGAPITPLISAARDGDTAGIVRLLQAGANPNEGGGVNNWPPLLHAIHKKQLASLRALIAGGADINVASPVGETPLMMAAGYGDTAAVRLLLAAGSDPRKEDNDEKTALDYAVAGVPDIDEFTVGACQTETVQALLKKDPALKLVSGGFGKAERLKTRLRGCTTIAQLVDHR